MKTEYRYFAYWALAWFVLVLLSLWVRPLIPINETRYIGVAWEMWLHNQWLVPHLNGVPYPDKPPLMFWLTGLGWFLFGVNDIWPRIIIPAFSLGTLFLTYFMAKALWSDNKKICLFAPTILIGCIYWDYYFPNYRFDMLLCFFTMLGLLGIAMAGNGKRLGWLLLALGIGFGMLSKGPVVLLFILFPGIFAPWWCRNRDIRWLHWYGMLLLAILAGTVIVLGWAIPAAIKGGSAYAHAVFLSQTTSRLMHYHTHIWDYLPLIPQTISPWIIWPTLWVGILFIRIRGLNSGERFTLVALVATFVALSLISQKGERYLLPLFPLFSLFAGSALGHLTLDNTYKWAQWPLAGLICLAGFVLCIIPIIAHHISGIPKPLAELWPLWGVVMIIISIVWILWRPINIEKRIVALSVSSVLVVATFFVSLERAFTPYYDVRPLVQRLSTIEKNQEPIAHVGHYDDQYHFLGRLKQPFIIITQGQIKTWAKTHPNGWIIAELPYNKKTLQETVKNATYWQHFRRREIAVLWQTKSILAHDKNRANPPTRVSQ